MSQRVVITNEHYYAPLGEWVENRIYPSADGGITVYQRYVTERKRAEQERRRSEAYLLETQRLTHTGSWAWNVSTGELFWSQEHFRIFGRDPEREKPSYAKALQWVHADDRSRVQQAFEGAVRDRADFEADCRIVRPDGTVRDVHSLAHPVFDDAGHLIEYVGTIIDATERRRAEETLRESERRFRLLAEALPHHVWSHLPDGSLGYWNQRLADYTGLTPEELRRGVWAALHPGDLEPAQSAWREAWSRGTPYELERRVRGRDGRYRRFLCRAVPVRDERGELVQWFGTDTDIEASRQSEEALRRTQAELAHVTRVSTVGELTASLAHELNQPLAAIATNAAACVRWLARDRPNIEEAMAAAHRIIRDANRAGDVIAKTRALLRKEGGDRVALDAAEVIREVLVLVEPEVVRHRIAVSTAAAGDLPPVLAARIDLQQVLLNLFMNAIEAMTDVPDPRTLAIRCDRHQLDDGPGVRIAVQDSGVGASEESLGRMFDAFYTTKPHGLGMGLSIARSIVQAHGGSLWATANADRGTTLQLVFPGAAPAARSPARPLP